MKNTNVMIDLETLGTTSRAPIISIGAVLFSFDTPHDEPILPTNQTFYRRINWDSAMEDRRVDADTIKWWMQQDDKAKEEVLLDADTEIADVLWELHDWMPEDIRAWGNGASFDISMLEDMYYQLKYDDLLPWKHWNVRDMRTLVWMAEELTGASKKDIEFDGVEHNALHDAIHQVRMVKYLHGALKEKVDV